MTGTTGLEASLEALPQLVLQMHTIINGYDTTTIHLMSIGPSFTSVTMSSISSDIELGKTSIDEEDKTLMETAKMFIERLPCYLTTILFRSLSITLTISFLQEYSPIPIIILLLELVIVATVRVTKSKGDLDDKIRAIGFLVVTNAGTMNAYTMCTETEDTKGVEEDDKDFASFITTSTMITTLHHFLVLIVIFTMGSFESSQPKHWESPEFLLKPSGHDFYWALIFTMVLGMDSLTILVYRARNIVAVRK